MKEAAMKNVLLFASAGLILAQTRGIVPEEVVQARPAARPEAKTAPASAPKPSYRPVTGDVTGSLRQPSTARQVGVTIWRLRAAGAADSGARILVQEEASTVEWVPERIGASSSLKQGDRVRLTIESPDAGFLYVIDRERYKSGERGAPYLIFPTTRTHGGDNKVTGGKLVDIPAQDDRPNFFSLHQSRSDQSEEELTVLLTKTPLDDIEIGAKALLLTNERVSAWEKQWGAAKTELFELTGGAGKTWTQAEQQAASGTTRLLTQEDPPPQTVYRVAVKPEEPLMVKVRLRYSAPSK
jgi:hypothetical protein